MNKLTFRMLFVALLLPSPTGHTPSLGSVAKNSFSPLAIYFHLACGCARRAIFAFIRPMMLIILIWRYVTITIAHRSLIIASVFSPQSISQLCVRVIRSGLLGMSMGIAWMLVVVAFGVLIRLGRAAISLPMWVLLAVLSVLSVFSRAGWNCAILIWSCTGPIR